MGEALLSTSSGDSYTPATTPIYCTLDIHISIHHNTSHYHRHTRKHHSGGGCARVAWCGSLCRTIEPVPARQSGGMAWGSLTAPWGAQQGAAALVGCYLCGCLGHVPKRWAPVW
ncbi:hypothetical protein AMECASPLE_012015 [Ameca splendens]|uniref:Uncharacterized protein n=1 Tax=Ameca splendens TaxID=208324 RepID=A0ABV0YZP0_9TELE